MANILKNTIDRLQDLGYNVSVKKDLGGKILWQ
jgi:hypothetical protein